MEQWRIFVLGILLCAQNPVFGLSDDEHLPPELSDALHLLRPDEMVRFSVNCLEDDDEDDLCSAEDVESYVWKFPHVDPAARTRFYHTYVCAMTDDPKKCPVDGGWSSWGEWGDCDTTCGGGAKTRSRECNWPRPQNGGLPCHGQNTSVTSCRVAMACPISDEEGEDSMQQRSLNLLTLFNRENAELRALCMGGSCSYQQVLEMVTPRNLSDIYWNNLMCYKYSRGCAVDGAWSEWSTWSICSSRCGTGNAYRSRRCTNPKPLHGGRRCEGSEFEEGPCFDDSCEGTVGVFLTPWSMWSECSTTCSEGVKTSTRRCQGTERCDVGKGQVAAVLSRELPCTNALCPVQGGWSEWSEWTVCTAFCDHGHRVRKRTCNNPRPQGKGNDCVGDSNDVGACSHNAPLCEEIPKNVPLYEEWSPWSACSSNCDGGMQIRHRTCAEEGKPCRGDLYNIETCNEDMPCMVDGGWTEWSAWSVCTVTCGQGDTDRYRQCIQPRPEFGGRSCKGEADEKKKCMVSKCPASAPTWGSWSEWSDCTVTCAGGSSTRMRDCFTTNQVRRQPSLCAGENRQSRVCSITPCPVNGNWAGWNDWDECSTTCGEGVVTRYRTCTDPTPEGDGKPCGGYGTETVLCYQKPCPDAEHILRTFDGSSFMMYLRAATPTKHLLLYMRFKPSKRSGLLALRHKDQLSDQVVSVGLADGYIRVHAMLGKIESEVLSIDEVQVDKWNSIEVTIGGEHCGVRLNDGLPTVRNFTLPIPLQTDWDQPMYIGGALPNLFPGPAKEYVGYVGAISKIRVNYKEYTLHDVLPEWTGVGLPYVSFNVGSEPADIDAQVTVLTGDEFTSLPCPSSSDLTFKIIFRLDGPDGILLYSTGQVPGSFFALTITDCRLTMFIDYGSGKMSAKSEEIALSKWTTVQLSLQGHDAELRINGGPAVQLTVAGTEDFTPSTTVNFGGVPGPGKLVARMTTGSEKGFVGTIYEVIINEQQYLLSETALQMHDTYMDAASTTIAAHYREIRGLLHKSVILHCNYANIAKYNPVVMWLDGDKILENSDSVTIVKQNIFLPYTSFLSVHLLNTNTEGLYTCMVKYSGKSTITHAFGVSMYQPHGVQFEVEPNVEIMIMGTVALVVGFIAGVIILSCFRVLRKRYYFLDMIYQSTVFYVGLDYLGCVIDPNIPNRATVRKVNATYDKDFSAREEKIKFDQTLKREKLDKLRKKGEGMKERIMNKLKNPTGKGDVENKGDAAVKENRHEENNSNAADPQVKLETTPTIGEINGEKEEPIYVNVETIRARKKQNDGKDLPADNSELSSNAVSPDTLQLLNAQETVAVDMDKIYENLDHTATELSSPDGGIPQEERRKSVALAGQDAGHLFSHRGSIGGAVAMLSEAVVDDLEQEQEEDIGQERTEEGDLENE